MSLAGLYNKNHCTFAVLLPRICTTIYGIYLVNIWRTAFFILEKLEKLEKAA